MAIKLRVSLADDLKYWRAERPSEWVIDEFIRKAEALEVRPITDTNYAVFTQTDNGKYEQLTTWVNLFSAKAMAANWQDKEVVTFVMGRVNTYE
jgi:hypothetical protein